MTQAQNGVFVTLEGIDGAGKSTQAARLITALEASGREVVALREPGGTAIGEKIRAILLDPDNAQMSDACELLLYEAARAQLVDEVIRPALSRGATVVCDRYYDSTFAYQAGGRGLDDVLVSSANALGAGGVVPVRTLVFDLDPQVALTRATQGGADRLEAAGVQFQERVRAGYLRLANSEPDRVRLVDADADPDTVYDRATQSLSDLFPDLAEAARD